SGAVHILLLGAGTTNVACNEQLFSARGRQVPAGTAPRAAARHEKRRKGAATSNFFRPVPTTIAGTAVPGSNRCRPRCENPLGEAIDADLAARTPSGDAMEYTLETAR